MSPLLHPMMRHPDEFGHVAGACVATAIVERDRLATGVEDETVVPVLGEQVLALTHQQPAKALAAVVGVDRHLPQADPARYFRVGFADGNTDKRPSAARLFGEQAEVMLGIFARDIGAG